MDNDPNLHVRLPNGRPLLRDSVLDVLGENSTFEAVSLNKALIKPLFLEGGTLGGVRLTRHDFWGGEVL